MSPAIAVWKAKCLLPWVPARFAGGHTLVFILQVGQSEFARLLMVGTPASGTLRGV